ncbi:MAG: M13 family metallopeptidase, partial [Alistipes sp.]|nr:M13 family metallopeptidase [Alistipes sp.]
MASCQNKSKTPAIDTANFDETVALNEDFYQHFTGGWQARNPLKPEYSRYGAFDVLSENNQIRINDLFSEMTRKNAAKGSVDQKISDLYKMGLDSVRLNAEGASPVAQTVGRIMSIAGRDELTDVIADMHMSVANPFFSLSVESDLMNSDAYALYVGQSGLGMGNRDYYLEEENAPKREAYREYLGKLFELAGVENAGQAVDGVLRVETALAEKAWSNVELRNMQAQYNPVAVADFEAQYPCIDWKAYFAAMGVPEAQTVIVAQPSAVANAAELLRTASVEDLRSYLAAQYLSHAAPYLSDEFYAASFEFFGRTMSGTQEPKPRWKRAMAVPNGVLSEAVGEMYVAKYFPERDKVRMLELVKNLQTALGQHIDELDWMSDETKARAQEKLATFTVKIGYPDKWKDYSTLEIDPGLSYWENIVRANRWATEDAMSKYGKSVDRDEWFMSPQTVNAYYNPTPTEICFPSAILQHPFYNPDADDAVNYGAIGVVIGHEMTHGFDDQGRGFDKDGNMNNWWTDADSEAFKAKADVLVAQFDAIEVLPGMHANGALCLGENIADQGGLRVAYT